MITPTHHTSAAEYAAGELLYITLTHTLHLTTPTHHTLAAKYAAGELLYITLTNTSSDHTHPPHLGS
jgi:hypothetical protein